MSVLDRYQNPVIGSTVKLQMFVYNSNNFADLDDVSKVEIYYLDPTQRSEANPDGRVLAQTVTGASVVNPETGEYYIELYLDPSIYTETGHYLDVWYATFLPGDTETTLEQLFQIYPELYYTSPIPVVYDFSFNFQPNKIRYGSKKYIDIEVNPNVPRATDLQSYYYNLAISANLKVYISQHCGDCMPCEEDLRVVVDGDSTTFREKNHAFYYVDTTELGCGIFDIWFQLDFGGNVYVSDKNQLQIYS